MQVDYTDLDLYLQKVWDMLLPYQKTVAEIIDKHLKVAVDAEGGSGKTLIALYAVFKKRPRKVLIVCSSNALWTWQKELQNHFEPWSKHYTVIKGTKAQRKKLWQSDSLFYVCTYGTLRVDQKEICELEPDAAVSDEYHKGGLKNRKSIGTEVFKILSKIVKVLVETSGSGIRKGPQDIWSILNINNHRKFSSYWGFVNKHCYIIESHFGKEIGMVKDDKALNQEIGEHYVRVPRSITSAQKPPLRRQIIPVEMSSAQKKYYRPLYEDMFVTIEKEGGEFDILHSSTMVGVIVKLRQLLCCPLILGIDDHGPIIDAVLEHISEVDDPHCVISTPFVDAIPHLKAYLESKLKDVTVYTLQGGNSPDDIKRVEQGFRANRNTICILSAQYAQSFELESAQYIHHVGYDWDQNTNEQVEWRVQRLTARKDQTIHSYYYQIKDSMDEVIMYTLNQNTLNVKSTFKSVDELKEFIHGKGASHAG